MIELSNVTCTMDITNRLRQAAISLGDEPLLVSPNGEIINLADGYIPLLSNFTFEDKAAKGLRKGKTDDTPEPAVYFSALELVRDNRFLLLSGPRGSGKTTFAKNLSFRLGTARSIRPHSLVRNELGTVHDESWEADGILPCYFTVDTPGSFKSFVDDVLSTLVGFSGPTSE